MKKILLLIIMLSFGFNQDLHKYSTQEVLNIVLNDPASAINFHHYSSQEVLNIALDESNSALKAKVEGISIDSDGRIIVDGLVVIDPTSLAGESLDEVAFTTHASWNVTNDFVDSGGNAAYTWSANQTSTLTQLQASLIIAGVADVYYKFTYTIAVTTAFDGNGAATITTAFALSAVSLDLTTGTHTIHFRSAAVPTDFIISVVSGTDTRGAFTIDDVTLKQISGGRVDIAGDLWVNGTDVLAAAGTDDQKIDEFSGSGNIISISIEDDGEAAKTVDISTMTAVTDNTAKVTMTYPGAGIALTDGSSWSASITNNSSNWNTAYTDRLKWDGGATDLVAGTGRTSLGGTTIGQAIFIKTNPGAITFGRANADNSFDWLSATTFRTAIGVDVAGTDNSTDVTLHASATTGGMSIATQEISNRAATNAQTGYMTAALVTNIETNNSKVGVTTEISNVVEDTSPQLGEDLELLTYEILYDSEPDANVTASGVKAVHTNGNGGNVVFGDVCYIAADGDVEFADASVAGTMPGFVMALATITTTNSGEFLLHGYARNDTWTWTPGGLIYVTITGTSTNTLSQTAPVGAGEQVQVVGVATHADRIYFNPSYVLVEI